MKWMSNKMRRSPNVKNSMRGKKKKKKFLVMNEELRVDLKWPYNAL